MGNSCRTYVDIMALHKEVTGSCILLIVKLPNNTVKRIVIDCGLFQEVEYSELNKNLPFDPQNIDFVIITHNHVDHTGRLPYLVKKGYRGKIYMSEDTSKLIGNALEDSYKVLKKKAKMNNESPLYSEDDVYQTLQLVKPIPFGAAIPLDSNIKLTAFMNGHLQGALVGLLQVKYRDGSGQHYEDINILFTGDYNNKNVFFDVTPIPKWVFQLPISIIQEATYGNMDSSEIEPVFEQNVLSSIAEGKDIIVPVFSLGRTQEILYLLKTWQLNGKLDPNIPIYYDGKLGARYTKLYKDQDLNIKPECKDFEPQNLQYVFDSDERRTLVEDGMQKIILCTSGMGSYGPAQMYLPIYLKRSNALIHFTGYCAEGSLGRRLYECANGDIVSVAGLEVVKKADVKFTKEFSAHAKADELIAFLKFFEDIRLLLINHGEIGTKEIYSQRVLREVDPKNVAILGRDYFYRIDGYGFVKSISTKFE